MKKVFSFFLSLLMIFQLAVPLTASAGDNPSVYFSTNRITPEKRLKCLLFYFFENSLIFVYIMIRYIQINLLKTYFLFLYTYLIDILKKV